MQLVFDQVMAGTTAGNHQGRAHADQAYRAHDRRLASGLGVSSELAPTDGFTWLLRGRSNRRDRSNYGIGPDVPGACAHARRYLQ